MIGNFAVLTQHFFPYLFDVHGVDNFLHLLSVLGEQLIEGFFVFLSLNEGIMGAFYLHFLGCSIKLIVHFLSKC